MNLQRLKAVALKEFRHIWRDGQTLFIMLSLPVVMMFLFGYALKSEIEEVRIVVVEPVPSMAGRELVQALEASRQFKVVEVVSSGGPDSLMQCFRARVVLALPVDYARALQEAPVQFAVWLDGSDPGTATTLRNVLLPFLRNHVINITRQEMVSLVKLETRFLFNPEQQSALFFVPGLMATILAMIGALLTSITVTKEKESGTLANLRISSLGSAEIILGKLLPYFVIAAGTGVLIMGVGRAAFGVVIHGSTFFLALSTALYLLTALGIGLMISTVVNKQQHAMLLALGITMMPTIMLSGFVFPVASLPKFLQVLSRLLPATWYLEIVRGVVLKASGWQELTRNVGILAVMAMGLLCLATVRFKKEK